MSDFYHDQIKARKNFDSAKPLVFDYSNEGAHPFPKNVVKFYLDSIHQANYDKYTYGLSGLSLLEKMLFLDFATTEGRQDSEVEKQLHRAVLLDLKGQRYDWGMNLTILIFMQNLDIDYIFWSYLQNCPNLFSIVDLDTMVRTMATFDPMGHPEHAELCEYMNDKGIIKNVSATAAENLEVAVYCLAKKLLNISKEKPAVQPNKRARRDY